MCPRFAGLADSKLYLPAGVLAPAIIEPVVERIKPNRLQREGWGGMLQLVASLNAGYRAVSTVIERHGGAAAGTPVFECGTLIGKMMRSLFLLDYLTKPDFRREVHKLLSQGDAVHLLQHALMSGSAGSGGNSRTSAYDLNLSGSRCCRSSLNPPFRFRSIHDRSPNNRWNDG